MRRFSFAHIQRAPLPDDGLGHEQPDRSVDRPAVAGDLGVGVLGTDLIAEEVRRLAGGVSDQRLGLRQFELEFLAQKRRNPRFDLFGLVFRTGKPQQPVIAVTDIAQPSIVRIMGVLAGIPAAPQNKSACFGPVSAPASPRNRVLEKLICPVGATAAAVVVLGQQPLFDVLI